MTFQWTNDLEVGNDMIDREHKSLIAAINKLFDACNTGKGRDELGSTIEFLLSYTKQHFLHEEQLQLGTNYPDYVRHKGLHEAFVKKIENFYTEFKTSGAKVSLISQVNTEIATWLLAHIKGEDKKIGKHVAEMQANKL